MPAMGEDPVVVNRAAWDELALLHGQDRVYDVGGFLRGDDTLDPLETGLVGDARGLDLLHLQCHFGLDTLSWARRGARVTGVDFSPVAIERARSLAVRAGLDATFIEADTQALPGRLAGRFDVAFASYGVLCWIGDLDAWMRGASLALRPGGRLVLVEFHPLYTMVDRVEPLELGFPYGGGAPCRFEEAGSYADPDLETSANVTIEFPHSVGEVVTAAIDAGLAVRRLEEHLRASADGRDILTEQTGGGYRLVVSGHELPLLYSLVAERPAA
jgi:SAM-dependent methyltransferase